MMGSFLPFGVGNAVEPHSGTQRIDVEDVLATPGICVPLVLITAQSPFGLAGHRIDRDPPQETLGVLHLPDEIDALETTEITTDTYMEYNERFRSFVIPALALLLVEIALLGTRFRKLP